MQNLRGTVETPFGSYGLNLEVPIMESPPSDKNSGSKTDSGTGSNEDHKIYRIVGGINANSGIELSKFLTNTFHAPLHNLDDNMIFRKIKFGDKIVLVPDPESITFEISSPGGSAPVGLTMYEMVKLVPAEVMTHTLALGFVASAASIIFCAGRDRIVTAGTEMLIHQAKYGFLTNMNEADMESYGASLKKVNDKGYRIYAQATGKSIKQIKEDMRDTDFMLIGKEIVEYGLATRMI